MSEEIWNHEDYSGDSAKLYRRGAGSDQRWSLDSENEPVYLDREAMVRLRDAINRELYWDAKTPREEIEGEQPCDCSPCREETESLTSTRVDPWVEARNDIMRMRVAIEGIAATMSRADLLKAQADAVGMGAVPPLCLSEEVSGRQCTRPRGHTSSHYSEEVEEETPQARADAVGSGYNQNLSPDDDRERCGGMSVLGDQCVLTDGHGGYHDFSRRNESSRCGHRLVDGSQCVLTDGHDGTHHRALLQSPRCTSSMNGNRCTKENHHPGYHVWDGESQW